MSQVSFDGVTKVFGEVVAVDGLDLDIADGEFLVLLGPSGCGKSTALRMLAGLDRPTAGTIAIGDRVVNDVDPQHRDVAMVFQSYALYPHLTVAKNIESPLVGRRSERTDKHRRAEQVRSVAVMLGLEDLLDRKPGQLSGGQRQRVALARAIVRRPAVFLMDEPLSNLDAKLRAQTRADIVDLHCELGVTFVYVTHDQVEAMTMASRIAILDQGALQQVGTPQDVYHAPANVFVARFIGSPAMNVLDGVVVEGGGVSVGDGEFPIDERWVDPVPGDAVLVGVRPEHLHLATEGAAATVTHVEWLGHEQLVHLDLAGESFPIRIDEETTAPAVGATVRLGAEARHVHLFDAVSLDRLATRS